MFIADHLKSVADSYDIAAERRDAQAAECTAAGRTADAAQAAKWAAACRETADDIRRNGLRNSGA